MATVIQAHALTKYYGPLAAVQELSLEVHEGEIFGLLGPNGAGKTTSINMICGLLKPDSGEVCIRGKPMTNGDASVRSRVGVCPQNIVLWGQLTCLEQMQFIGEMYGMRAAAARVRSIALLQELDLTEKKDELARKLSGGMQRRLNLAMALVHDPEILVMDEPEAGLDPQSRVLLREFVRSLARRKTVLLTTHNMDEADRMADRVAIIDHGRLLVVDTPEALKRTVGEGDVLEIELESGSFESARSALASLGLKASIADHTLVLRARAVVERLAPILETLKSAGARPGEVRLRANSLEDVFISVTGRRLRE